MENNKSAKAKRLRTGHMNAMRASLPSRQAAQPFGFAAAPVAGAGSRHASETVTSGRVAPRPGSFFQAAASSPHDTRHTAVQAANSATQAAASASQAAASSPHDVRSIAVQVAISASSAAAASEGSASQATASSPHNTRSIAVQAAISASTAAVSAPQAKSSDVIIPRSVFETHKSELAAIGIVEGMATPKVLSGPRHGPRHYPVGPFPFPEVRGLPHPLRPRYQTNVYKSGQPKTYLHKQIRGSKSSISTNEDGKEAIRKTIMHYAAHMHGNDKHSLRPVSAPHVYGVTCRSFALPWDAGQANLDADVTSCRATRSSVLLRVLNHSSL